MERIETKRFEDFPSTALYLDDLSEIIDTLAKVCRTIEVKAGDYKITDPTELPKLASQFSEGRFNGVYITGEGPYVSVDLRTSGISVYVSQDTLELRGLVAKVRDIVVRGKKRNPHLGWFFSGLSNIAMVVAVWQFMSKEYSLGALLAVLSLASIPISVSYGMKNSVIVYSQPRGSVKTFFERKRDDIALAVIAAFLGGVVTYLTTKFLP